MKHLELRQKYSVARRILNSLLLDILHHLFSLVSSLFYNLVLVLRQDIISTLIVIHVLEDQGTINVISITRIAKA